MADDRLDRVREEFSRQAETFDAYAGRADVKTEDRFLAALGAAATGRVLDVACGPGVVACAVAKTAAEVVGLDATEAMLDRARRRAAEADLANATFQTGDAENLPFEDGSFDGVVTRLSLHHFADPAKAVGEMRRVLKPGGRAVIVDVVSSEDPAEAELHNAIEILRDPSHIRMLPPSEMDRIIADAGFQNLETVTWDKDREFDEWMGIVNDPTRVEPLRVMTKAVAEAGRQAGIGLRVQDGQIHFFHRWRLAAADRS